MKPRVKKASSMTPDGGEMVLYQHDHDFSIIVNGEDLMHSRRHESEFELARLGCAHLVGRKRAIRVLIGGLGMGYTLCQTLDMLGPEARVVVGELVPAVAQWNREFFGRLNDNPLADQRVELKIGDIVEIVSEAKNTFDTILLDVDNGPEAMTDSGNLRLYGHEGILACRRALRKKGCLAVWSAKPNKDFEELLMGCGFHVRRYRAPAHKGKNARSNFIYVASENKSILPVGGGEARIPQGKRSKGRGKRTRS